MNIEVQLAGETSPRRFENAEQLQQWIKTEAHFWNWLAKFANQPPLDVLYRQSQKTWNKATQLILELNNLAEEIKSNRLQEITGFVSTLYSQSYSIPSDSGKAQFIEKLRATNVEEAGFTLLAFLRPNDVPTNNPIAVRGMLQAYLFDLGISGNAALSEKEALRVVSNEWFSFKNTASKEHANLSGMIAEAASEFTTLLKEETQKCEEIRNAAKQSFGLLENVFREKLALLAPVTYWSKKAEKHLYVSIGLGIAFGLLGGLMAWIVWLALEHFVIDFSKSSTLPSTAEYWRYTVPAAIATLFLWPMRILARMLLSNLHLREDALERVTMVNTYLSLSEGKQGLKDDDRKLILEMLFRPSTTGIVQDDATPPSLLTYISKASSGKH